jgi:hypothetical protein
MAVNNKVFCIGFHKCYTKSIAEALEVLGYKSFHWDEGLARKWHAGKIGEVLQFCEQYDAVSDLPFPLMYRELFDAYPDAQFIYTYRSTPEKWADSLIRHMVVNNKRRKRFMARILYGDDAADGSAEPGHYIKVYLQHMRAVREFFEDKSNYLELCIEHGHGWQELCEFLDKPVPDVPFPHLKNKNNK